MYFQGIQSGVLLGILNFFVLEAKALDRAFTILGFSKISERDFAKKRSLIRDFKVAVNN